MWSYFVVLVIFSSFQREVTMVWKDNELRTMAFLIASNTSHSLSPSSSVVITVQWKQTNSEKRGNPIHHKNGTNSIVEQEVQKRSPQSWHTALHAGLVQQGLSQKKHREVSGTIVVRPWAWQKAQQHWDEPTVSHLLTRIAAPKHSCLISCLCMALEEAISTENASIGPYTEATPQKEAIMTPLFQQ